MVNWGQPLPGKTRSTTSTIVIEPGGIDVSQPPTDLQVGKASAADNFVFRDGALEPRPMLASFSTNSTGAWNATEVQWSAGSAAPLGRRPVTGGIELSSSAGSLAQFISKGSVIGTSGDSVFGFYSQGSWSRLSYLGGAGGMPNSPPTAHPSLATAFWDFGVIPDAGSNSGENVVVASCGMDGQVFCWQFGDAFYSNLTGTAAGQEGSSAKYYTAFDGYLVAFYVGDFSGRAQRVRWTDRYYPSRWTGGLSGYADLADMNGGGTRIIGQEDRMVLFTPLEVWQGTPRDFPFTFNFAPIDRTVGCPYSWTVVDTPLGVVFLTQEFVPYLLPKGGGPPVPIGEPVSREIRRTISNPSQAWAVYNGDYRQYQLYYPTGSANMPNKALYLDLGTGGWYPQSLDSAGGSIFASRGWQYTEMSTTTQGRAILVATSLGSIIRMSSTATNDLGKTVRSVWRSGAFGGESMHRSKTVQKLLIDYQADSASSLSVQFSQDQGANFESGRRLSLHTASVQSQVEDSPYQSSKYPMFQVSSETQRHRIMRFHLIYKETGR